MPEPDITVEIAWEDSYLEPFPTWTDITDRVNSLSTNMGRSAEAGAIETGTVSLELDNSDGAFTPGKTDSPFYPNIKPRRQVRIRTGPASEAPVERLENLVVCPSGFINYGFKMTGSTASASNTSPDFGYIFFPAGVGTVRAIATEPKLRQGWAAAPGDYVSATVSAYVNAPSVDFAAQVDIKIRQIDAAGVATERSSSLFTLPTTSDTTARPFLKMDFPNVQLIDADTVAVEFALRVNITAGSCGAVVATDFALYNHGATPFAWPADVICITGADGTKIDGLDGWRAYWTGGENKSSTIAVGPTPEDSTGLARGLIEEWPVEFGGPTPETVVSVVDWFAALEKLPSDIPYVNTLKGLSLECLFTLAEETETTERFSAEGAGFRAVTKQAFPYTQYKINYGKHSKKGPRMLPQDESDMLPGNPEVKSVGPSGQWVWSDGQVNGVCIDAKIPHLTFGEESWAISFRYLMKDAIEGAAQNDPVLIALIDPNSRARLWIQLGPDVTPDTMLVYVKGWNTDDVFNSPGPWANIDVGTVAQMGLSWNASDQTLRLIMFDTSTGDWIGDNSAEALNSLGGSFDEDIAGWFGDVTWARVQILGWKNRGIRDGFGEHEMSMLAVHSEPLFEADLIALDEAANGREGDTVDQRINAALDSLNWPRDMRDIDEVSSVLGPAEWASGTKALALARTAAEDAKGLLYVDAAGRIAHHSRFRRVLKADPDWTFDLAGATGIEAGLKFRQRQDDLINQVALSISGGGEAVLENADSVAEYGPAESSLSVSLASQDEAFQYGYHLVNRYGDPVTRIDAVSFRPSAGDGTLWPVAQGIRIGDRVRLSGLPETAPATSMDFFVESVAHDIARVGYALDWRVTVNLSPAQLSDGWVLGRDALGSTTRLHF